MKTSMKWVALAAVLAFSSLSAAAHTGEKRPVEAGPIWNQADANQKCPALASANGGNWTGGWWTTQEGVMSVCEIEFEPSADQLCESLLDNKVAYNWRGDNRWAQQNMRNLCAGTRDPVVTISCFKGVVAVRNDWRLAIEACKAG